jgi:hypothetical protein
MRPSTTHAPLRMGPYLMVDDVLALSEGAAEKVALLERAGTTEVPAEVAIALLETLRANEMW